MRKRKLSQVSTVNLLKIHLDLIDDPRPHLSKGARRRILALLDDGDVATAYVLRNIGKKRTKRLMEFLHDPTHRPER